MFYIIELFSNDLQELFNFVVDILSQYTTISNARAMNGRWSASTQYFRLSVYVDGDRELFDKEDFGVKINTILWFDVVPASGYASVIISLLKTILKKYSSDIVMFNTGYWVFDWTAWNTSLLGVCWACGIFCNDYRRDTDLLDTFDFLGLKIESSCISRGLYFALCLSEKKIADEIVTNGMK